MGIAIGEGIEIGSGISFEGGPLVTTSLLQNVGGSPNATGFFYAVLNRGIQGADYFAANGNNGTWTATGNFGSGSVTIPVVSITNDADSIFPVVDQGLFQPGSFYTFQGY
jgi:hypothetical protein